MYRGSRKHILDWISQKNFTSELLDLIAPIQSSLPSEPIFQPRGYDDAKEARLEEWGPRYLPNLIEWTSLKKWWLAYSEGANTPNWDLVVATEFNGIPGLTLVEAKANLAELKKDGKTLDKNPSADSTENHKKIGQAIEEARSALETEIPGIKISRDIHYQLSNRVAYSWKLASLGVPVLLVYLGFIGDQGISDVGDPLTDVSMWESTMQDYIKPVLPTQFLSRWIPCVRSQMCVIIRSRQILEQSPSKNLY